MLALRNLFHKFNIRVSKILFFTLVFLCYSSFAFNISKIYAPTSPDENQFMFYSKFLAENKSFIYSNPLNETFDEKIFVARNYAQEEGRTLPGGFLGHYIIGGLFYFINPDLVFFISPLFGTLILLIIYNLSRFFTNERVALGISFLVFVFPPFFLFSVVPFNNIVETFFFITFIYYLLKTYFNEKHVHQNLLIATTMGMAAIWIRYIDVVFIGLSFFIYSIINKSIIRPRYIITVSIVSLAFMLPLLYSNSVLYGGIFELGQTGSKFLNIHIFDLLPVEQISPFIPFRNFDFFFLNTQKYIFDFLGIYLMTMIVFTISTIRKASDKHKKIYYFLIGLICIYLLYYLGGYFSGYDDPEPLVNSSYTRYLLTPYIFILLLFGIGISNITSLKKTAPLLVLLYIFTSSNLLFHSKESLNTYITRVANLRTTKQELISETEENSIIFTKYTDKILYPERNVALYPFIKGDNPIGTGNLVEKLIQNGFPIYWIDEGFFEVGIPFQAYRKILNEKNFSFTLIDGKNGLYKITKNE